MDEQNQQQTVSAAIIRINASRHIEYINLNAEELLGMTAAELTGKPVSEIFCTCPECPDLLILPQPPEEGGISRQTVHLNHGTGRRNIRIPATIIPLPGSDTFMDGAVICLEDTAQGDSDSLPPGAGIILDSLADGIFTVDCNWIITSFNRAAETITGWTADQAMGKSCSEVFQSNICGKSCAIAESLYSGRSVFNRSIIIRSRTGEQIPISVSAAPLADCKGNIIGGVETFRDLSVLNSTSTKPHSKFSFNEIVSKSRTMHRLFAILPEVAASPSTVMIYGESGTGKELIAREIYRSSTRKDRPFVAINCGALPESLLESELFGYKAGAFTDARKDKEGRFAAARGGTLFLDEIGDIPKSIQIKLLRVLQEKVYEPLGSNTSVEADVRIITATNRDLQALVRKGRFREDLYYRLNVVRIQLPSLRERKEDIPLLVNQFIKEFSTRMGKDIVGISNPALTMLMGHDFPGNIRELKNIIEYSFILCEGGFILPAHLPKPFDNGSNTLQPTAPDITEGAQTLENIERQAIYLALEKHRWNNTAVCEELGISRDTLRRKMAKYHFERPLHG